MTLVKYFSLNGSLKIELPEYVMAQNGLGPDMILTASFILPQNLMSWQSQAMGASALDRIRTNNGIERIKREIRRRTRVVGTFPDGNSALMLVTARPQ